MHVGGPATCVPTDRLSVQCRHRRHPDVCDVPSCVSVCECAEPLNCADRRWCGSSVRQANGVLVCGLRCGRIFHHTEADRSTDRSKYGAATPHIQTLEGSTETALPLCFSLHDMQSFGNDNISRVLKLSVRAFGLFHRIIEHEIIRFTYVK